jgi:hypothetical protein
VGRRRKRLDPSHPLHAFAIELRDLRDAAGPAGACKATCELVGIHRTTYYAWLQGTQLPGARRLGTHREGVERRYRILGGTPSGSGGCTRGTNCEAA